MQVGLNPDKDPDLADKNMSLDMPHKIADSHENRFDKSLMVTAINPEKYDAYFCHFFLFPPVYH